MVRLSRFGTSKLRLVAGAALACLWTQPVFAQVYEAVGTRAQGMGGAFVAVADDATATWWNPAGLATGAFFNGIVERRSGQEGSDANWGASVALPSLGISYYRLSIPQSADSISTAPTSANRQDGRTGGVRPHPNVLNQFGVTLGQSLGDHFVVGSTISLVWADQARGDVDVGAMARFGPARLAIVLKHLGAPDLTSSGKPFEPDRQVRAGVAFMSEGRAGLSMTGAVDADLTKTSTVAGDERHLAGGVEVWIHPRLGVRGGASVNTIGTVRPSFSAGGSVAFASGVYADGQITRGDDEMLRGWGLGLRVTF
jgi:hypothetical protein